MLTSIRLLTYPYRLSRYICTVETSRNGSLFYFAYQNIIPIFAVQTISTIVDKIVNCFKSLQSAMRWHSALIIFKNLFIDNNNESIDE